MPRHEYVYQPLDTILAIRLLVVYPAPLDSLSPIYATLRETSLDDPEPYDAVSYSWATEDGDDERSELVMCDGAYIKITQNCKAALHRFRLSEKETILWVDAICIDQSNLVERSQQVLLMKDIYLKAKLVLIWVGKASSDNIDIGGNMSASYTDVAIEYIKMVAEAANDDIPHILEQIFQRTLQSKNKWTEEHMSPICLGLYSFFCRRWWGRLWVLQEASLNPVGLIFCGRAAISVSDVNYFIWQITKYSKITDANEFLGMAGAHLALRNQSNKRSGQSGYKELNLLDLLQTVRHFNSSDKRDKVFGLKSFFQDKEWLLPLPDYSKSVATIYAEVVERLVSNNQSLDVLCACSSVSDLPDLPSWAPDWSINTLDYIRPNYYNASKGTATTNFSFEEHVYLNVMGKLFSDIVHIATAAKYARVSLKSYDTESIRAWPNFCRLGLSLAKYPTGESASEVLWRTLCANVIDAKSPAENEYRSHYSSWYDILFSGQENPEDAIRKMVSDKKAQPYYDRVRMATLAKTICITSNGYIALVPEESRAQDHIVLLAGGRTPFILRPLGSLFRLIGPCYVHGIMDGEAFSGDDVEMRGMKIC